jgi:hypothetical protein
MSTALVKLSIGKTLVAFDNAILCRSAVNIHDLDVEVIQQDIGKNLIMNTINYYMTLDILPNKRYHLI